MGVLLACAAGGAAALAAGLAWRTRAVVGALAAGLSAACLAAAAAGWAPAAFALALALAFAAVSLAASALAAGVTRLLDDEDGRRSGDRRG